MSFIKVTQIERNSKAIASELMLLDVNTISRPIVENSSNNAIILVQESIVDTRQPESINAVQFVVSETLAAVEALSNEIFVVNVVTRNGKPPVPGQSVLGFVSGKVVGGIREEGSGSKFYYHEDGDYLPVEYVVQEDINTIEASL